MAKATQQSWFGRFFGSRWFLLTSFAVLVIVGFGYARAYYDDYKIKQEIRLLEQEIDTLSQKKLESMELLKYVMSDQFVEETARVELNQRRPGEKVVIMNQHSETISKRQSITKQSGSRLHNPKKWWYFFTHQSI